MAARARLPHEPVRRAARVDRGGRARLCASGRRRRIELDYEIDGIVIKVDSLDQQRAARRAARAAALGARLQVGADDGADDAAQDPHPRRPHRQRSTRGRSSSRSRSAASPSRRRRCTTRRTSTARTSARATSSSSSAPATSSRRWSARCCRTGAGTKPFRMPTHCPLCGAEIVKPEGEVMHRCPNRACPSRAARDADQLGAWPRRTSKASAS